ncbi:transposable element Tcb2 transposase [Trichonephila clavipes]|uniref:Transposable element Tcb2 transposase n=1 Tax=Trichonephila clavipes TaxID=2585209 RepID=A0A8X6RZF9_TRICX|nr:transposable element Tcb2 transposase [Trichonephila clavipes]
MTAQRFVHDILQPHVASPATASRSYFLKEQCLPSHGKDATSLRTVTTLPCPTRFPDLAPIEHIWVNLRWRVGPSTSLNELEARLQQIWNEMFQDIIQNLYARLIVHSG